MRTFPIGLLLLPLFLACAPRFVGRDVTELLRERDALWPVDTASSYSVYGGYGSECAHDGAHIYFGDSREIRIFSPTHALVTEVKRCIPDEAHDKYGITLNLGMKGSTPVYLDLIMEPRAGQLCSGPEASSDAFRPSIFVNNGQKVSRGEQMARIVPTDLDAHIHMNLRVDGATMCPEIFSTTFASDFTFTAMALRSATCGSQTIATGTVCHGLTPSEDPERLR